MCASIPIRLLFPFEVTGENGFRVCPTAVRISPTLLFVFFLLFPLLFTFLFLLFRWQITLLLLLLCRAHISANTEDYKVNTRVANMNSRVQWWVYKQ